MLACRFKNLRAIFLLKNFSGKPVKNYFTLIYRKSLFCATKRKQLNIFFD